MQALYMTGVTLLFLSWLICIPAAYVMTQPGNILHLASLFDFLAGIFFLAEGIYMVCMLQTDGDQLGWNYTFIYTWIGWQLCWMSSSMLGHHGKVCNAHCEENCETQPTTNVETSKV